MGVYEKKDKTLFEYVCTMGDTLRKEYIMENRLKNLEKKVKEMTILLVAIIFFVGHIIIAMTVVSLVTGASIWEAGAVALVEPAVNSIWFFVLHKVWNKLQND